MSSEEHDICYTNYPLICNCGNILNKEVGVLQYKIVFFVTPCASCLSDAYKSGQEGEA